LRQLLSSDGQASGVVAGGCKLAQPFEKAQRLKNCCVDSDADSGVAVLDPLESGTAREGAIGHHTGGKTSAPAGIAKVLPKLTKGALNRYGGAVWGWHGCKLHVS
jgi:hypothetical protein